jgi:hypothetical protein
MAKDLYLVRRESMLLPLDAEGEEALRDLPQGKMLRAKITQPRSVPHNAFFHAFLQEVYPKWPKGHRHQPETWEHLRAWLLCKVGHCRRVEVEVGDASLHVVRKVLHGLAQFHEDEDRYYWHWVERESVIFVRPLTLRFDTVDENEFKIITEAVFREIYEATGLDADEHHKRFTEAHPERSRRKS